MLALRRTINDPGRCQDVVSHRLIFCEAAQCMPTEHLLLDCWCCDRFLAYCCACTERQRLAEPAKRQRQRRRSSSSSSEPPRPCHYYKVALVSGACSGNGQDGATAGIGIAIGVNPMTMHWAIPVDDDVDACYLRTSQRAELLAALYGIYKLADDKKRPSERGRDGEHMESAGKITWVITSDSEYVVSGMTEWVPNWKNKGWRNSAGRRPKNVDLFQRLDMAVNHYEREYGVRIAFWRISRVHNELADGLAGVAAQGQTVEPLQFEPMYPQSEDEMEAD